MRNEVLMGYVFHYNPYKDMWAAVPREYYLDYFNGIDDKVVFHESVNSLVKYISKEWQSQPKNE